MGCCERFECFPHGKSCPVMAAIILVIVSFAVSLLDFQLATHIPGLIVLIIVLCTTVTTVSAEALIVGAVLCFVNCFFCLYQFYMFYRAGLNCDEEMTTAEDRRWLVDDLDGDTNSTNSVDEQTEKWQKEFCDSLTFELLYNVILSVLWGFTGWMALKIPQPGSYSGGQTTTFESSPETVEHDLEMT